MLKGCQHAFCLGCLVIKFEGNTDFTYSYCQNAFALSEAVECKIRSKLVQDLVLKCKCGHESKELEKFNSHKAYCTFGKEGQDITVGDLLTMDLSESAIPSSVEKATLKILEHKMSDSQDGTAKFASG